MIKTRLKKSDTVKVLSGNSKGSTGKILFIDKQKGRVIVEGVNIVHKHQKATQKNPQPAIIKREAPINITNVALVCPKTSKQTRIGTEIVKDPTTGKEKRMRLSKKSGEIIIS